VDLVRRNISTNFNNISVSFRSTCNRFNKQLQLGCQLSTTSEATISPPQTSSKVIPPVIISTSTTNLYGVNSRKSQFDARPARSLEPKQLDLSLLDDFSIHIKQIKNNSQIPNLPSDLPPHLSEPLRKRFEHISFNRMCVEMSGPKGQLSQDIDPSITVEHDEVRNRLILRPELPLAYYKKSKSKWSQNTRKSIRHSASMLQTTLTLLENMMEGVCHGLTKTLKMIGVGYRCRVVSEGRILELRVGYCHPVYVPIPHTVNITCNSKMDILINGVNAVEVGRVAGMIRLIKPPNVYTGKGIRYATEKIVLKGKNKKIQK